jgi:hypothetical protein
MSLNNTKSFTYVTKTNIFNITKLLQLINNMPAKTRLKYIVENSDFEIVLVIMKHDYIQTETFNFDCSYIEQNGEQYRYNMSELNIYTLRKNISDIYKNL